MHDQGGCCPFLFRSVSYTSPRPSPFVLWTLSKPRLLKFPGPSSPGVACSPQLPCDGAPPTWVGAYCTAGKVPVLFPWGAFAFCGILSPALESTTCENLNHSWICSLIFSCRRSREGGEKDCSDHPAGSDTCWCHQAFSNYSLILLWCSERSKPNWCDGKAKAPIWEENHVMGGV